MVFKIKKKKRNFLCYLQFLLWDKSQHLDARIRAANPWRHMCNFMPANPLLFRVKPLCTSPLIFLLHRNLEECFPNVSRVRNRTIYHNLLYTHAHIYPKQVFQNNAFPFYMLACWQFLFCSVPFHFLLLIPALSRFHKGVMTCSLKIRALEPRYKTAGPQASSTSSVGDPVEVQHLKAHPSAHCLLSTLKVGKSCTRIQNGRMSICHLNCI